MGEGFADEAIVVVKLLADEDAVTYLRIKAAASDIDVGGEGWNMISSFSNFKTTVVVRSSKTEQSVVRNVFPYCRYRWCRSLNQQYK